jgi:hypothetical protein
MRKHTLPNFGVIEVSQEERYGGRKPAAKIYVGNYWFSPEDIDSAVAFLKGLKREMKGKPAKVKTLAPATKQIWDHLQKVGSISNVEAQAIYRCRALPRRIKDIEEVTGVSIKRDRKQDATGQRYTRYSI